MKRVVIALSLIALSFSLSIGVADAKGHGKGRGKHGQMVGGGAHNKGSYEMGGTTNGDVTH